MKRLAVRCAITQDDSLGSPVVAGRQGSEALLARRVLQNTSSSVLLDPHSAWEEREERNREQTGGKEKGQRKEAQKKKKQTKKRRSRRRTRSRSKIRSRSRSR